jgi:hypothetical protein
MKSTGLIFLGLCLLPTSMLTGNAWLFAMGASLCLIGDAKILFAIRQETAPYDT